METSKIPATSKYSEQDEVIINNSSPFSRIKYLRTQTIETFVGRENELVALTEMLANVVTTDSAFGVKISGPPASGKSTLFGYFATLVKTGEIFKMPYCRLKKGDASVKISFIDAPKEELMSARFFWKSMILSWDEEKFDFLEIFAAGFMLKALIVLYENGFNQGEIKPLLLMLHPNLDTELTRHPLREVLDLDIYIEKFIDRATSDGNFLAKSRAMIYNGFRVLQKHTVQIRENKVQLRIEKPYIDNLVDMLSVDLEKQSNAKCRLIGDVDELFKSDTQVINLLNWFIETLCWVEEKQACFVIGIDNIGYLTEELENKNQIYSTFVQTILQLRNRLKGFLFVFIGTTTDWDGFNKFVNSDKDLPGQLVGFFTRIIELVRLNETETRKALTQLITSFWFNRKKTLPPGNPCYPFSPDFFTYLYDLKTHNYREMLTLLNQIWDIYKRALVVIPLVNPFDMIRFVHFDMMSSGRRDIVFSNLVPWEQERILAWFDSIESSFKAKDQSKMVEQTLVDCFEILMAEDAPRQVRLVSKQAIKVLKDDGSEINRIPDVYVELEPSNPFEKWRAIEIQVKIHRKDMEVKIGEIESSFDLLVYSKTDALLFVMTGPGLEERAIDRIKLANLQERIIHAKPLDIAGRKILSFMCAYNEITGDKPSVFVVKDMLSTLFSMPWDEMVEKIKNIGAYRATELSRKALEAEPPKGTLEAALARAAPPASTTSMKPRASPAPATSIVTPSTTQQESMPDTLVMTEDVRSSVPEGTRSRAPLVEAEAIQPVRAAQKTTAGNVQETLITGSRTAEEDLDFLFKKFGGVLKEMEFIIEETLKRGPKSGGRVTRQYLKNHISHDLSDEEVSKVFGMLEKDAKKNVAPLLFTRPTTSSIEITGIGRTFFKRLMKNKEHGNE